MTVYGLTLHGLRKIRIRVVGSRKDGFGGVVSVGGAELAVEIIRGLETAPTRVAVPIFDDPPSITVFRKPETAERRSTTDATSPALPASPTAVPLAVRRRSPSAARLRTTGTPAGRPGRPSAGPASPGSESFSAP